MPLHQAHGATVADAAAVEEAPAGTWLVFGLGGTEYAVDVGRVQQIIGLLPITRVPRMPEAVRGVVNLRGRVIPVVDLRLQFGLPAVDHGQRTCIIVVRGPETDLGLVVDRVAEVVQLAAHTIENVPQLGDAVDTAYLLGIAQHGERVLLLLEVERALPAEMTVALNGAAVEAAAETTRSA